MVKETGARLFLAGDFNNWHPSDRNFEFQKQSDGTYRLSKTSSKGIHTFKVTRGSWQRVECTTTGKPIDNRSIKLWNDTTVTIEIAGWQDNFKSEEKKHTASANVHIISEKFEMPQLGRQRRIWIYLPSDYKVSHKKYPVVYMHDGQNLFDNYTSGYGEWGIDEILDKMPQKYQCIFVGIDHGSKFRMSEYDPYDSKYGKGQGDAYVDFLVKTLKPYIDQHYRTKADVNHTSVAGSSMGGLISMYAILKYPDVFGSAGMFSPSFWIAPDMFLYVQQHLDPKSRFYFVCGDAEGDGMVGDMEKMAALARSKGVSVQNAPKTIINGAEHNEKQWSGDFPAFYSWLISESGSR